MGRSLGIFLWHICELTGYFGGGIILDFFKAPFNYVNF
jgi:hypothetical protein